MSYFYDLHCHTIKSACSIATLEKIIKKAKERGLDGIAITDHNKLYKGPYNIDGIDIIPGVEISTSNEEHLLAYYVKKDIKRGQSFKKTIEDVRENNGYVAWAHPLRDEDDFIKEGVDAFSLFDGLEAGNALNSRKEQELISKKVKENSLLNFTGSDAHMEGQVGMAVVKVKNKLNKDNFKEELKNGEIIVREEAGDFRRRNYRWKKFMKLNKKVFNAQKNQFIKNILVTVFLRNYLRLNNISMKKIEFNYKKEKT